MFCLNEFEDQDEDQIGDEYEHVDEGEQLRMRINRMDGSSSLCVPFHACLELWQWIDDMFVSQEHWMWVRMRTRRG